MKRTTAVFRSGAAVAGAAVLSLGLALGAPAFGQPLVTPERLENGAPYSFADLIEQVSPAVVSIDVTVETDSPFGFGAAPSGEIPDELLPFFRQFGIDPEDIPEQPPEATAQGSGFFISPDGYIVTNNHVVNNATSVTVVLKDGDEIDAEIIGTDENTDLAVLKVERSAPFPFVEFAEESSIRVGDWVVAMGNPFGLGGTATAGIVSATGREISNTVYNEFLQIDASINRGNSGGPTFDLRGNVVGVNSQIFS
ncbi:MAG: trypsin-like peptidase domain-containing protein, partial [Maricaulaceae bacterium]